MKDLEYDEFEMLLERSGDGFSARVVESPTGTAPAMPFVPPLATAELPALRLTMRGSADSAVAAEAVPASVGPKAFGTALFRALFNDKAINILRTSQFVAARNGRGLRLRIRFADVAELANLPWELLYDPDKHKYPCQYRTFPTIRLLDLPEPEPPIKVTGPLRMLVVISGPKDLPELDVEKEWMHLRDELAPLVEAGRVELVRLEPPTLEALRVKVLAQEFHVFHFVGHGGINADGEGHLAFVNPNGLQHDVLGSQLGVMLSNSPIRLAVLNSCEGGTVSAQDPYGSAAIALVEQGIPAVIAMQFPISDVAAQTFSRTLYDSVAAGRSVDLGVTLGRQALLATSDSEWATPVLYLRGRDGVLFELKDGPVDTILDDPVEAASSGPVPMTPVPPPTPAPVPVAAPEPMPVSAPAPQPEPPARVTVPASVPVASDREAAAIAEPTVVEPLRRPAPAPVPPLTPRPQPVTTPTPARAPSPARGFVGRPADEPIEVKVRHLRRLPIVIVLVLALAVAAWWATRPGASALAAPTNVTTSIEAGLVSMSWDEAPVDGPAVDRWEVYLGDELVATVTGEPKVSFRPQASGQLDYRVIAVAADGKRSEPAVAPVSAPPITTPSESSSPSPSPPTTSKPPAPAPAPTTADIEITVLRAQPAEGGAETVTFETDNLGKAKVIHEEVFVEALGGGQIYAAEFRFEGGDATSCAVDGATASCDLGGQALKGVFHIEVTVGWEPTSTGLMATVKDIGGTKDQDKSNNSVTYEHVVPTDTHTMYTFRPPDYTATIQPPAN